MARLLYLECASGISGDMAAAALLDVGADEAAVRRALSSLPVDGFEVSISRVVKSGLDVCDFDVVLDSAHENHDHDMGYLHGHGTAAGADAHGAADGDGGGCGPDGGHSHDGAHGAHHGHRGMAEVEAIIDGAAMTDSAKAIAKRIFSIIAEAEARAHGQDVSEVHFHEVGAVDSIADIVAIAVAFDSLDVEGVVVTALPCGRGMVRCQHGIIPIPAPATAFIAERYAIPLAPIDVEGELVTPTGIAAVAALRTETDLPDAFTISAIGMGAGKRDYDTAGILRAMIIEPRD